jgi:PST family polysaccharide transporter
VFSFLGNNVDDLIIGKVMGTQTLGYYQNAFSIGQSTIGEVGDLSAQAAFPVLSRISGDLSRLRRAMYMAIIGVAMLLAVPLMFVVFFNHELVLLILGEKWLPAIPVLPWLAGAAYLQALNTLMHVPNMTRHKTRYSALISIVYFVLMVSLLVPFSRQYGLVGAGIALFLARLLLQPVAIVAFMRVLYKKKI